MTTHFRIIWPSGKHTVSSSETRTVDAYAMERFGFNSYAEMKDFGIFLEVTTDPVADDPVSVKADEIRRSKAAAL